MLYTRAPHFDPASDAMRAHEYDVPKLHGMGAAVAHSLADMVDVNAQTRLTRSEFRSLDGLHAWIKRCVRVRAVFYQ